MATASDAIRQVGGGTTPTVVLAEDNPLYRDHLRVLIGATGMKVVECSDGRDVLSLVSRYKPVAAVIDLIMPHVDGLAVIHAVRLAHPHLKIIAMSSGGRGSIKELLDLARDVGADEALAKPFAGKHLLALINDAAAARPPSTDGG